MEALGVIRKADEPTEWVSSLVVVQKLNGKVRVCLDPRDLNKAIQREHYPMKTVEEVAAELSDAKVFSVLDATSGFWHIIRGPKRCQHKRRRYPYLGKR